MANMIVPSGMLERGEFPPVCCKTGGRADSYTRWRFAQQRVLRSRRFDGVLPISKSAQRRAPIAARAGLVLAMITAGLLIGGAPIVAAVTGVIAGLALLFAYLWTPGAHDNGNGTAELRRVHPGFVRAVLDARGISE